MNRNPHLQPGGVTAWVVALAGLASLAHAGDPSLTRNRFYTAARFSFNISAELRNLPVPASARPNYDDGFVRPDISGGAGGKTWNWGYGSNDQLVGSNLELHSAASPRDGTTELLRGDPQAGFEILYGREFGRLELSRNRELVWGLQGGFGSMDVNLSRDGVFVGKVNRTTDQYSVAGIVPPLAPYAGTFNGPGPLINANPAATTTAVVPAASSQTAKVNGLLYGFKAGPFLEVPLFKRVSLQASAGVAAVNAEADLSFTETLTLTGTGGPPPARAGKFSSSKWLLGFYGNCALAYALTDNVSIFAGGQYQHLGDLTITGGGKEALLKAGETFEGLVGLKFSF